MDVRVEGQVVDAPEQGDVAAVLQKALSGKKFKSVVAARVTAEGTETLCDLSATVPAQCTDITPVYADSPEGLSMIRHSTAHVMAAAVKKLYPSAKVTIGPAVENGFYYDFDVEKPFSSEDFPAIEAEMQRIVNERLPFVRTTMSKADAIEKFSKMGENFKVEIIEGIEGATLKTYQGQAAVGTAVAEGTDGVVAGLTSINGSKKLATTMLNDKGEPMLKYFPLEGARADEYSMAFPKGSELTPIFNEALAQLKESGKLDEMIHQWLY